MKFLVSSIIVLIIAIATLVVVEAKHKTRMEQLESNFIDDGQARTYDSVAITQNVLNEIDGMPARQASDELTEFMQTDELTPNSDPDEDELLEVHEECCAEEDMALSEWSDAPREDRDAFWKRQERQLREKHGDVPEIHDFIKVARQIQNKEQPTLEDYIAHLRALSILIPTPGNIDAYKQMTENTILQGTFRIDFEE